MSFRTIAEITTPERPTPACAGEVYGYGVVCEIRGPNGTLETKMFRSKGKSEAKARRSVILRKGVERVVVLDPYTREQWLRVFGEGRM